MNKRSTDLICLCLAADHKTFQIPKMENTQPPTHNQTPKTKHQVDTC